MAIVKINQQQKRLELNAFEVQNEVVFEYFNKLPASERDDMLYRAVYIGVLALMEDRLSSFLAKTQNELGTQLESLKLMFDMKKEVFYKTAIKGSLAEDDIAAHLGEFLEGKCLKDSIYITGNSGGKIKKNKTGDIVCELAGNSQLKIVIECKFDKGIKLGDISNKEVFTRKYDTAWSQLIEAQANREAKVGIIIFDISLVDKSIQDVCDNVAYIPSIGFIAIVDSQRGDYSNLEIAYMLSRDIAMNSGNVDMDCGILSAIVNRIIKDATEILKVRHLVEQNIENNKSILKQISKSMMLIEFSKGYLARFLETGTLTKEDLLEYYLAEDIRSRFALVEKDINDF